MPYSQGTCNLQKICRLSIADISVLHGRVFPSKMTAWSLKTRGVNKFAASQPTGSGPFLRLRVQLLTSLTKQGRIGIPQDIAAVALFLSSPASAHVTGAHILLDGGRTLASGGIAPQVKL